MYFYKIYFTNTEVFNDSLIKTSGSPYLPLKTREIIPCVVGRQTWEINYKNIQTQHIKKQRRYFVNKSQGYGFSTCYVCVWELDYKESRVPKNWCFWTVVLEKTLESPLDCKEIQLVHPKGNQSWVFIGRTDWWWSWNSSPLATWCEELTHLKRSWCWERLKMGGEGDVREWYGWMVSPTQWTWVWVNSRSWWWTGRPGMLQSTGSQNWTELNWICTLLVFCFLPYYNHHQVLPILFHHFTFELICFSLSPLQVFPLKLLLSLS